MTNPAETYESFMVPTLFEPWALKLIEMARPQAGERILDVGCGTGIVSRRVAQSLGRDVEVTGVDLSPAMLEVARDVAAWEGLTADWREGRAEDLPFPDASFDAVLCQFALMFFQDKQAAINEMFRVIVPGGRLAFDVFQAMEQHPFYVKLDQVIQRHLGDSGVGDIFAMGDQAGITRLLTTAGFQSVVIHEATLTSRFPNPDGFLAGEIDVDTASISSMQSLEPAAREELVQAISGEMAESLKAVIQEGHVVLPFHVFIVEATRPRV